MNVNEVIAYRGHVLAGGKLTDKEKILHPNDDVNKSQSSNDTFPTAMHIAAYQMLVKTTIPGIEALRDTLAAKSKEYMKVVKIGRTHFMDATPLTVGQEFSGYVSQLDHGLRAIRNTLAHLSELALGGTAVGTGINTPPGYSENVAQTYRRAHRPPLCNGSQQVRGARRARRHRRGPWRPEDSCRQPDEDRQRYPDAILRPALRHRRDPYPRQRARLFDHAREGKPHAVRSADDDRRTGARK